MNSFHHDMRETMNNRNVEIAEQYISALKERDFTKAHLASAVTFQDPTTPVLRGREAVIEFLLKNVPEIRSFKINLHISQGEYVAIAWDADTTAGEIPIFEYFRIIGGEIKEIRAYLNPCPLKNETE